MTPIDAAPRLLVIEDDTDLLHLLQVVLSGEGYQVTLATSLPDALAMLQQDTFDFVLTDLFRTATSVPPASALPILKQAAPTPVGILTAWNLTEEKAREAGFACLINKPFDLNALMATIASILNTPLTPEQEQQAGVVRGYIAALVQHDIEQVLSYCTEDMVYHPPAPTNTLPHTRLVRGKADYRAYLETAYAVLQNVQVEQVSIFPHPTGLAVRYSARWTAADGTYQQIAANLVLRFEGKLISRFGFQMNEEMPEPT